MRKYFLPLLLFSLSLAVSLLLAVVVFHAVEPRLFGEPADLRVVKSDERALPFFQNLIAGLEPDAESALISDPVLGLRGTPFFRESGNLGPHDLLGFRNREIPARAELVFLGDSQLYGINTSLEGAIPAQVASKLNTTVYSASLGGWSAAHATALLPLILGMEPQRVILGVYTGNDSLEAFRFVYGEGSFPEFQRDPALGLEDLPTWRYPAPPESYWRTRVPGHDSPMIFTPELRLAANEKESTAVREGYRILEAGIEEIAKRVRRAGAKLHVLLFASKELVYSPWFENPPAPMEVLLSGERGFREQLQTHAGMLEGVTVHDSVPALRSAIEQGYLVYPPDHDGHPLPVGYAVISAWLASEL